MTRKQARMRRRGIRIAGFCLAGCILILGIVCGAFHHYVSQFPEDKIAENIYVGTVDLSGKTGGYGEGRYKESERTV